MLLASRGGLWFLNNERPWKQSVPFKGFFAKLAGAWIKRIRYLYEIVSIRWEILYISCNEIKPVTSGDGCLQSVWKSPAFGATERSCQIRLDRSDGQRWELVKQFDCDEKVIVVKAHEHFRAGYR